MVRIVFVAPLLPRNRLLEPYYASHELLHASTFLYPNFEAPDVQNMPRLKFENLHARQGSLSEVPDSMGHTETLLLGPGF